MTNDTTTLNGSLRELGELMATNLTTQGVASTYDEGLTTLANKILDIQGGGTTQTLSLSVDNPILSYKKSDSATLTAKLRCGDVANKTVEFFKGTTSLGTSVTDSNGIATKTYNSTGVGNVNITAKIGDLTSETVLIEDCGFYDPLTNNSGEWTIPSGVTGIYSPYGWRVSATSYKQIKLTDKITEPCSVEITIADYNETTSDSSVIIYSYTNGETTPNQVIIANNYATSMNVLGTTLNRPVIKGAEYKIEYTASTISVYENGELLKSASSKVGLPTRFEIHTGSGGRYTMVKDLKVKPL